MPVLPRKTPTPADILSELLGEVAPIAGQVGAQPAPEAVVPATGGAPSIPTTAAVQEPPPPPTPTPVQRSASGPLNIAPLPSVNNPNAQVKDAGEKRMAGMVEANEQIGAVPDLRVPAWLQGLAKPPEEIDNTPVVLPDAETTDYSAEPERDWRREFSAARDRAGRDRALNEVMRSAAGINAALSGGKRDEAFFDRAGQEAGRGEAALQKEYELDILANKGRQNRAEKDPSSPQNRAAQEFFAANFGHLIPKDRAASIRNMTGDQLLKLSGGAAKMQLALAEIQSKGAATALAAQKEISREQEKFIDQVHKRESLVTERGEALTPIPKIQPGMEDPINVRAANKELAAYTKASTGLREIAGLVGELDQTVPGILAAKPEEIQRLGLESMPEETLRRYAPSLAAAILDKNPQETRTKEQALNIRNTIEKVRRHEAFGSALTAGEQRLFDELVGRGWNQSSSVLVTALQVFHRALRRRAEETDYALRRVTASAPSVYEGAYQDGLLNHQFPVFSAVTPVPSPTPAPTAGNKTNVSPGGKKQFIPIRGSGTREDPYVDADGNKRVQVNGKLYKLE